GELGADRLMLCDRPAALHAKLRVFHRGLIGGAADADVDGLAQRDGASGIRRAAEREQIAGRHAAVLELDPATVAVIPARAGLRRDAEAGRVARNEDQGRALVGLRFDRDQLGDGGVGDVVFHAVDDEVVAAARRGGGDTALGARGAVIVYAERGL